MMLASFTGKQKKIIHLHTYRVHATAWLVKQPKTQIPIVCKCSIEYLYHERTSICAVNLHMICFQQTPQWFGFLNFSSSIVLNLPDI